jgi:predicted dehydrogenase
MSSQALPVAIIGVGGFGSFTLQALRSVPTVKIVGVSDRNPTVAEQAGRAAGVPAYSDNRSLLAETHPRAVYLAVPPMAGPELIAACAERGIAVWKEPPLARDLDEGVALVRRMERAGLKFAVGTQRRFATGYRKAWQLRAKVGPVFLVRAHYLFNWGPELRWRADKASAGGGALLELGYHLIDLMIWLLGMPEEVYGLSTRAGRPRSDQTEGQTERVYDTDDTAAALLRFRSGVMASVVTTRSSGPVSEELSLHGRRGSLTADSEMCTLRDPDGNVLDGVRSESGPVAVLQRQAEAFAAAVASDSPAYECSGLENLLNLAVIEAIYLSDSTCQPENPSRLLASRGFSVQDCLSHQPGQTVAQRPPGPGEGG